MVELEGTAESILYVTVIDQGVLDLLTSVKYQLRGTFLIG